MKPSHLQTPRTLAECYFVEGHSSLEPSMWRGRWLPSDNDVTRKPINMKLIGFAALCALIIMAPLINYLIN